MASGYVNTTMLAVAQRCRSSKETLYRWFNSKEGLFAALIEREAEATNQSVAELFDSDADPVETLLALARNLLLLLTGPRSIAINRAAMHDPELARLLLTHGRHRTGPLVEEYLQRLRSRGILSIDDPGEAFQLFYGLVLQDLQIRTLLGEAPPSEAIVQRTAEQAVQRFLTLAAP